MSEKDQINFKYLYSDDYNPIYVNGAYGGINPKGELVINFYFERHGLPKSQSYELTEKGTLGEEIERKPDDLSISMVRSVQTGIVLTLQSAKEIYNWLGEEIKKLEQLNNIKNDE